MKESLKEAKEAVSSGYWSLYRYNPTMVEKQEPNDFGLQNLISLLCLIS